MLEFDTTVRTAITADRLARLAADYGEPRRSRGLRRRVGLRLVALGLLVAGSCPPQGASAAASTSVA